MKTGTDRRLLDMFTAEVKERSSAVEATLLAIENSPDDGKSHLQGELLKMVHSLKGAAGLLEVRPVETLCHRMEDLLSLVQQQGRILAREETHLLLAATDSIADAGRLLSRGEPVPEGHGKKVLDAMTGGGGAAPKAKAKPLSAPREVSTSPRASDVDGSLRVSGDRLDSLLYRSGELLASNGIIHSRAEAVAALREQARSLRAGAKGDIGALESGLRQLSVSLGEDVRRFHASAAALENEVRQARMQPFSEACMGLGRLVRDLAEASGKIAVLEIHGGHVEIDRSVLSRLQDALRHLVRNAVAHGIETPEERRSAGKAEAGKVIVSASVTGDRMQVRVEDDGRGFDLASLRAAAAKAGLAGTDDERQLLRQVFEPGVTTSRAVTRQSGRGVGLEIVRAAAEGMRGLVVASQLASGGAAFTLTVPLTLATTRAMQVLAGGVPFAVDIAAVQRATRVRAEDLIHTEDKITLASGDRTIPVLDLASWLGLPTSPSPPRHVPAVVIGQDGTETVVLVDEVCGEMELLARSLGPRLEKLRHYSGATVLPDGRIALLLNVSALAEAAESGEASSSMARPASRQAKRKVLVVDDSTSIRTMLKLVLEASGYEVATAGDGNEALQYLEAQDADAVVADIDMPLMDGYCLTQTIRASEKLRHLPVVLVTGRETRQDRERGLEAGASAFITKAGFDQQHFLEIVGQVA